MVHRGPVGHGDPLRLGDIAGLGVGVDELEAALLRHLLEPREAQAAHQGLKLVPLLQLQYAGAHIQIHAVGQLEPVLFKLVVGQRHVDVRSVSLLDHVKDLAVGLGHDGGAVGQAVAEVAFGVRAGQVGCHGILVQRYVMAQVQDVRQEFHQARHRDGHRVGALQPVDVHGFAQRQFVDVACADRTGIQDELLIGSPGGQVAFLVDLYQFGGCQPDVAAALGLEAVRRTVAEHIDLERMAFQADIQRIDDGHGLREHRRDNVPFIPLLLAVCVGLRRQQRDVAAGQIAGDRLDFLAGGPALRIGPLEDHPAPLVGDQAGDLHVAAVAALDAHEGIIIVAVMLLIGAAGLVHRILAEVDVVQRDALDHQLVVHTVGDRGAVQRALVVDRVALHFAADGQGARQVVGQGADDDRIGGNADHVVPGQARGMYHAVLLDIDLHARDAAADVEYGLSVLAGHFDSPAGREVAVFRFVILGGSNAGALIVRLDVLGAAEACGVHRHITAHQVRTAVERRLDVDMAVQVRTGFSVADALDMGEGIRVDVVILAALRGGLGAGDGVQLLKADDARIPDADFAVVFEIDLRLGVHLGAEAAALGIGLGADAHGGHLREDIGDGALDVCNGAGARRADVVVGGQVDLGVGAGIRLVADAAVVHIGIRNDLTGAVLGDQVHIAEGALHRGAALDVQVDVGIHRGVGGGVAYGDERGDVDARLGDDAVPGAGGSVHRQVAVVGHQLCAVLNVDIHIAAQVVVGLQLAAVDEAALGVQDAGGLQGRAGIGLDAQVLLRIHDRVFADVDVVRRSDIVLAVHHVDVDGQRDRAGLHLGGGAGAVERLHTDVPGVHLRTLADSRRGLVVAVGRDLGILDPRHGVRGLAQQIRLGAAVVLGQHAQIAARDDDGVPADADGDRLTLSVAGAHTGLDDGLAVIDPGDLAGRSADGVGHGIAYGMDADVPGGVDDAVNAGADALAGVGIRLQVAEGGDADAEGILRLGVGLAV